MGNVPLESCANQYTGNEGSNVAKVNNQQLPNEIQKRLLNSAGTETNLCYLSSIIKNSINKSVVIKPLSSYMYKHFHVLHAKKPH